MDGLDLSPVAGILSAFGWGGIVALAVWLVFTGRLIPRATVDRVLQQAGEEAQRWRTAYENEAAARVLDRETAMKSLDAMQTTTNVVRGFVEAVAQDRAGDPR